MNLHRRHLTESQRAVCALEVLPLLEQEAKIRMKAGGGDKRSENAKKTGVEFIPHPISKNGTKSREEAAKLFGTNGKYVSDVKKIVEENPEYADKIKSGELTIPKAKKKIKEVIIMFQSLTQKYLDELMSGSVIEDVNPRSQSGMKKAVRQKSGVVGLLNESREERLRRVINFGKGFYSIAEAGKVSGIGEAFIRKWIGEGKLMLLGHPEGKRLYISGIELSELVIQYNLNRGGDLVQGNFQVGGLVGKG